VLAEVDARITEFTDRIGDAYREQESRISRPGRRGRRMRAAERRRGRARRRADAIDAASAGATIDCGGSLRRSSPTDHPRRRPLRADDRAHARTRMKTAEIAQRYLDYFEKNGTRIVPSASLVTDDPRCCSRSPAWCRSSRT
jgi:hypothetical protein